MLWGVRRLNVMIKSFQKKGFTLIEVVIATFIVGMALIAVVGTIQSITAQTSRVQEVFVANLIAKNTMAELQLNPVWSEIGENSDTVQMANLNWFKDVTVIATEVETLRRVEISVGIDNDKHHQSSFLVGFISQSPQMGQRPVQWIKQDQGDINNDDNDSDSSKNPDPLIPIN